MVNCRRRPSHVLAVTEFSNCLVTISLSFAGVKRQEHLTSPSTLIPSVRCMTTLPKLRPLKRSMKALGVLSRPSTICSRCLIRPSRTH
jgi:hypothetical protein